MNGIIVVNKKEGFTSRDIVNIACKKLNTKKIGHTGTLDPLATGVLVMGVNKGTKIIELLTSDDKEYEAEIILGILTTTNDITGTIIDENKDIKITKEEIQEAISKLVGINNQTVPLYSAVHVNGKRLYEYARNNIEVELPKRDVNIFNIDLISNIYYEKDKPCFNIRTTVSKGTYIRSLIDDIGKELGFYATMKNLKRTRQGIFLLKDAIEVDDISYSKLIKIEDALSNYNKVTVDEALAKSVKNGAIIDKIEDYESVLIYNKENELLALYKIYEKDNNKMKPHKMFWEVQ
ncbi:MAG: tRNA pseudouridine(55) synthase TruB [Bacilli bacterium]|nr:tRNA pseudouridine(55) synthase TruB [Bacilli bacterium]